MLYDELLRLTNSPVVALNRAVAVGKLSGARAGLAALADLASDPRLDQYQPYWAARAELLAQAGNTDQSRAAYTRAIGLTIDPSVRQFLTSRAEGLGSLEEHDSPLDSRLATVFRTRGRGWSWTLQQCGNCGMKVAHLRSIDILVTK